MGANDPALALLQPKASSRVVSQMTNLWGIPTVAAVVAFDLPFIFVLPMLVKNTSC